MSEYTVNQLFKMSLAKRADELIRNQRYWTNAIRTGVVSAADAWRFIYFSNCPHEITEVVSYVDSAGRRRYKDECQICGHCGSDISVKNWSADELSKVPARRTELNKTISNMIRNIYQPVIQELRHDDFMAYYKTSDWAYIRDAAMRRDHYECQICGGTAQVAHHLTYDHFKNEYLFEIVSLCQKCHHDYFHPEKPQ